MRVLAPIFENLYQSLTGKRVQDFYFYQRDGTINQDLPLYNFWTVVSLYIGYYVVIFGLQRIMKGFQPIRFKNTVIVHNIFLSSMSLALLLMIVERLISPITEHGLFYAVCSADMWKDRGLELLYYINYLFKYYELLDTVFLVLAKKDLEFLHVYHHGMTLWLTWTQLAGNTSVQWVPIVLNLAVHVLVLLLCPSCHGSTNLVEEVFDHFPDRTVFHRSLVCLLLQLPRHHAKQF